MKPADSNGRVKKKGKKREVRHTNRLLESEPDMIGLGESVETRFLSLCHDYLRITGEELQVPTHLHQAFIRWREMRVRHKQGDLRNTDDERKSVKEIAEWTLRVNCEIRNQEYEPIDWGDF